MGIEAIGSVLKRNRLRWFGHVERKDKEDWVRRCMYMEVEGARARGRPRRTWLEVVRIDMRELHLRFDIVFDFFLHLLILAR